MSAAATFALIQEIGVIPVVRGAAAQDARFAAEAVHAAGLGIVEVSMTTPSAVGVIGALARSLPDVLVGAGAVVDATTARRCIDAGARFVTSPGFSRAIVDLAAKRGVLVLPGAVTPTDVMAARDAGVRAVRVFPCAEFGGPALIRVLRGPFPQMHLVAAGGVNQQTAGDFIRAGATAIGVGAELTPRRAVEQRDRDWIAELAQRFRHAVHDARAERPHADHLRDHP